MVGLQELAILGGSAGLALKILGPTAEYVGEGLKSFTERRVQNVQRIFENAGKKLGDRIENSQESVPPRVLKGILDDGSFCEDAVGTEYFGGVLAASRSGVSRDDRGAAFLSLISSLSVYQLRAHYVLYAAIKNIADGSSQTVGDTPGRRQLETFMPWNVFDLAMAFEQNEEPMMTSIIEHLIWGLVAHDLVDGTRFGMGDQDFLAGIWSGVPDGGIIFQPSALGAELFLWAHGRSDLSLLDFLTEAFPEPFVEGIEIPQGSCLTHNNTGLMGAV